MWYIDISPDINIIDIVWYNTFSNTCTQCRRHSVTTCGEQLSGAKLFKYPLWGRCFEQLKGSNGAAEDISKNPISGMIWKTTFWETRNIFLWNLKNFYQCIIMGKISWCQSDHKILKIIHPKWTTIEIWQRKLEKKHKKWLAKWQIW